MNEFHLFFQNGASVNVRDAGEGSAKFREGMSRRTEQTTDYGPAQHNAATVIHIDLQMVSSYKNSVRTVCYCFFKKKYA